MADAEPSGSYDRDVPALADDEARRRLAAARRGQLATASPGGVPHVVPITFAAVDGTLYSAVDSKPKRSTRLRRLANIEANPAVSVLVDEWDEDWDRLWWVRADGAARLLGPGAPSAEHDGATRALRAKYAQYATHALDGVVVAVDIGRVTGWASRRARSRG